MQSKMRFTWSAAAVTVPTKQTKSGLWSGIVNPPPLVFVMVTWSAAAATVPTQTVKIFKAACEKAWLHAVTHDLPPVIEANYCQ